MSNIPNYSGVFSSFRDISLTGIAPAGSTRGIFLFFADQGKDNKLDIFLNESEFKREYGNSTLKYQPYNFGHLNAKTYTTISPAWCMRLLPQDATYSNVTVSIVRDNSIVDPNNPNYGWKYEYDQLTVSSEAAIDMFWTTFINNPDGITRIPLAVFFGKGRGSWYNKLKFRVTKPNNQTGRFTFTLYKMNDAGDFEIVTDRLISTNPDIKGPSGENIFIESIVNDEIEYINCKLNPELNSNHIINILSSLDTLSEYPEVVDIINSPTEINIELGDTYMIGNRATGQFLNKEGHIVRYDETLDTWLYWNSELKQFIDILDESDESSIESLIPVVYGSIIKTTKNNNYIVHYGNGYTDPFDVYLHGIIFNTGNQVYSSFNSESTFKELGKGSEGSLLDQFGMINTSVANELLSKAFIGDIDSNILNTEDVDFSVLIDAGYPTEVKNAIAFLSTMRQDFFSYLDNGFCRNVKEEVTLRKKENTFNNRLMALFSPYVTKYIPDYGRRMKVPVSSILSSKVPINDRDLYPWASIAGYSSTGNKGIIEGILDIEYNPVTPEERTLLKDYQINPITRTSSGIAIVEQVTTLINPSVWNDIHINRLYLYIDKNLKTFLRFYKFEVNNEHVWRNVAEIVSSWLNELPNAFEEAPQIEVYADEYARRTLKAFYVKIYSIPNRLAEKILLEYNVK